MNKSQEPQLMVELLPELSAELEQLLRRAGKPELANQLSKLQVLDRCRCGDDFCASFYTQPKPRGQYGPGLRTLELDSAIGYLILDVVDDCIAHVEVLYRDEIRLKLLTKFP
jgi:hypothetical protein